MARDYLVNSLEKISISITETKVSIGKIEEHLANLNSKVATNVEKIEKNRLGIEKINLKMATWGGVFAVLVFLGQFLINKYF